MSEILSGCDIGGLQFKAEIFNLYQFVFKLLNYLGQNLVIELEHIPGDFLDLRNIAVTAITKATGLDKHICNMHHGRFYAVVFRLDHIVMECNRLTQLIREKPTFGQPAANLGMVSVDDLSLGLPHVHMLIADGSA